MAEFTTFRTRDLDLGSGHTAYRNASLVDLLPSCQISLKLKKLRGRTGGWTFETRFIRSTQEERPKKQWGGGDRDYF